MPVWPEMREWLTTPIRGVLFDLDGVVTRTATVHCTAWKRTFDRVLEEYGQQEFSHQDYLTYVDGKSRDLGISSFLASRNIYLPDVSSSHVPAGKFDSIESVGKYKQALFLKLIARYGVAIYPSTLRLIRDLKNNGISVGLVTSSKNSAAILEAAGLAGTFDIVVDGLTRERLKLKGKPDPDIFLAAAKQMGWEPSKLAVVEDSVSGIEAARRGNFARVIGLVHSGSGDDLVNAGADIVVRDLKVLNPNTLDLLTPARKP